jgi:hypothetical protein
MIRHDYNLYLDGRCQEKVKNDKVKTKVAYPLPLAAMGTCLSQPFRPASTKFARK